ncbi:CRE-CLEC-219 protein [Caenorhabditis remanei]|uniref:CRE-CLEC-219 protein n=1 Tax=Caenorhabditis remanei TaxID=31234 RepID=E3N342_CAERE|nr:CRE-CLEC-219 protein [Caenorhabditis remanei]
MVSHRLLLVLFILAIEFVTGENPEDVPCEEETTTRTSIPSITPTTVTTTTTTVPKTTTINPCGNVRGPVSPYRRKNGYWCSLLFFGSYTAYNYDEAKEDCVMNKLVVGSLEVDQEYIDYIKLAVTDIRHVINAYWVGASLNTTTQQYYWDDGQAVQLMNPQPTVVDPNGHVAWFLNKNSSVPGYGDFRVVAKSGFGKPNVNSILCGAPGIQFN